MRLSEIKTATEEQLRAYLSDDKICCEPGCYNTPARGLIICIQRNYGQSERASDEAIAAKRRLVKLTKGKR